MTAIANLPDLRPSLLLDFANSGRVDPRITFSRASAATRWNAAGILEMVSAGVPRIDYHPITGKCLGLLVEGSKTNMVLRSTTTGAVLGLLGSGGSLPTGWTATPKTTSGMDTEVVSIGTENGLPYVDMRFFGTPTAAYQGLVFGNVSGYAANTDHAGSVYVKLLAGSAGGAGSLQLQARYNISGSSVNITTSFTPTNLSGDLRNQRLVTNGSTDSAATGSGQLLLVFNLVNGTAYDFTVRVAAPQLETGPVSSVIFTDGAAATRAAEAATLDLPTYGDIAMLTEYQHGAKLRNTRALGLYAASATASNIAVIASNLASTSSAGVVASPAGPNSTVPGLAPVAGRTDRVAFSRSSAGAMLLAGRGATLGAGNHTGTTAAMQTICIGNSTATGIVHLDGYVRRVAAWFRTLTQAELNKITEV
jgi:hypothetical protein